MGGPIEGNIKTTKNPDETSTVEYVPEEEGPYVVNIKYDGDYLVTTWKLLGDFLETTLETTWTFLGD